MRVVGNDGNGVAVVDAGKYGKGESMNREKATELEYLQWFYGAADFGPADGDVRYLMDQEFREQTGKDLPEGYGEEA